MNSPARSTVSASGGAVSAREVTDSIDTLYRKDGAMSELKSEVMEALPKEVRSLDEDNWMFVAPHSCINLVSRPGIVAALTNESATSKSVYFSQCMSEMIYITHLLPKKPEKLAGPLLADTYVTLLKGCNAWYGQKLAKGELTLEMGDSIKGKGTIQGVSAVNAFYELLSQGSLSVMHPETKKPVAPVELCPILKTLYKILIKRDLATDSILQAIRDESMYDPRERIELAQRQSLYRPSLLGLPKGDAKA